MHAYNAPMDAAPPSPRRWFRFSLRSFLLLALVCGAGLGWQLHVVHERAKLRSWLEFRDALVMVDRLEFWRKPPDIAHWGEIPWHRRLFGDEPVMWIVLSGDVSDESMAQIKLSFPEGSVEREGRGPALNDEQYAAVKQREAEERIRDGIHSPFRPAAAAFGCRAVRAGTAHGRSLGQRNPSVRRDGSAYGGIRDRVFSDRGGVARAARAAEQNCRRRAASASRLLGKPEKPATHRGNVAGDGAPREWARTCRAADRL